MPEMTEGDLRADGAAVYEDETDYDYRQLFRDSLAAPAEAPPSGKEFCTEESSRRFKYGYAAVLLMREGMFAKLIYESTECYIYIYALLRKRALCR